MKTESRKKESAITIDFYLNGINSENMAQLSSSFLKFIMFSKGQIPLPHNQLRNYLYLTEKELLDYKFQVKDSVMKPKEKSSLLKEQRQKEKIVKAGNMFNSSLEEICKTISRNFEDCSHNQKMALILGTSIFNPKEIFILDWTCFKGINSILAVSSEDNDKIRKQNEATFFRFLVTSEALFPVLQPVKNSHLHVMFETGYSATKIPVGCIPRLNFKFHARGQQVILRILPKSHILPLMPMTSFIDEEYNYVSPQKKASSANVLPDISSSSNSEILKTVSRRLVFSSPSLFTSSPRVFKRNDDNCNLSGIIQLEDDLECSQNVSTVSEEHVEVCWIQVKNPLRGFKI